MEHYKVRYREVGQNIHTAIFLQKMAPRRASAKNVNTDYSNVSLSDVLCPICRCILIQPITLPCNHDFCSPCFEGTLINANLTCPLCRVRFGSWHRIAKRDNKTVNIRLWEVIKSKFPCQVQNRLQGIDEMIEQAIPIKLSSEGEIRQEYEIEKRKQEIEMIREQEAEEKASNDLIEKIKRQDELEQTLREEKLRLDEEVARKIAEEMGFMQKPAGSTPKKPRPLDKFLSNLKETSSNMENINQNQKHPVYINSSNKEKSIKQKNLMNFTIEVTDNSNDSIENECRYFKPIDHRNIPPSKSGTLLRIPAVIKKATTVIIGAPSGNVNFSYNSNISAFAKFTISSSILDIPRIETPTEQLQQMKKRKYSENAKVQSPKKSKKCDDSPTKATIVPLKKRNAIRNSIEKTESNDLACKKLSPHKMILRDRKLSTSPLLTFDSHKLNGFVKIVTLKEKEQQERKDLEFAKKLQEQFNKERYSTRSSITCRSNIKKPKQVTLKQLMSASKCK